MIPETASDKTIVIFGGANGCGKTTFATEFMNDNPEYIYLSADDIARELSGNCEDISRFRVPAGRLFSSRLAALISENRNLVIESTLSGKNLLMKLDEMKKSGYKSVIFFVFVDNFRTCFERILQRIKKGEHFVPEEDVKRRFYRSISNFWELYRKHADRWYIIDNSEFSHKIFCAGNCDYDVFDNEIFLKFKEVLTHEQI